MLILTSYFDRMNDPYFDHLKYKGVSIDRTATDWKGETYPDLYQTPEMVELEESKDRNDEEYSLMYIKDVLSKLDPLKVYNDLHGKVLLCHESLDSMIEGPLCHRCYISDWLEYELDQKYHMVIEVKELTHTLIKERRLDKENLIKF